MADNRSLDLATVAGTLLVKLAAPFPDLFVGMDVGEKFLDLAWVECVARKLTYDRIGLAGLDEPICDSLAERIKAVVPGIGAGTIAIVDSPRWPRDVDSRAPQLCLIDPAPFGRCIDASLRKIYRELNAAPDGAPPIRGLSMFPTPRFDYFNRCARDPACSAHLRAAARELFAPLFINGKNHADRTGGGTFTRFMLAGFATYRALEKLGAAAYESYPDLQLRLCAPSTELPPKKRRREALKVRNQIVAKLKKDLGIHDERAPKTLDEADAAALALAAAASARRGGIWAVTHQCEGRFLLSLDETQSKRIQKVSIDLGAAAVPFAAHIPHP
jgi:hypothetical protein